MTICICEASLQVTLSFTHWLTNRMTHSLVPSSVCRVIGIILSNFVLLVIFLTLEKGSADAEPCSKCDGCKGVREEVG